MHKKYPYYTAKKSIRAKYAKKIIKTSNVLQLSNSFSVYIKEKGTPRGKASSNSFQELLKPRLKVKANPEPKQKVTRFKLKW